MPCWKCQAETPDGEVECQKCAGTSSVDDAAYDYEIDWSKLKTAEDFRTALSVIPNFTIMVRGDTPEFDKVKQWLRPHDRKA